MDNLVIIDGDTDPDVKAVWERLISHPLEDITGIACILLEKDDRHSRFIVGTNEQIAFAIAKLQYHLNKSFQFREEEGE